VAATAPESSADKLSGLSTCDPEKLVDYTGLHMVDESGMGMVHHCGSNILIDSSIDVLPILHQLITQAVLDQ
jgi:hypothetical protein